MAFLIHSERVHPVTLRFADARLEREFDEAQTALLLPHLRRASLWTVVFTVVLWLLLDRLFPEVPDVRVRFAWPVGVLAALMGPLYALSYRPIFRRRFQRLAIGGVLGISAVLVGIACSAPLDLVVSYGYALTTIHVVNAYGLLRLRVRAATIVGVGTTAMYVAALARFTEVPGGDVLRHAAILVSANLFGFFTAYQADRHLRGEYVATKLLARERARSEELLLNMLPPSIAARLKESADVIAESHAEVTVLFADVVGFTQLAARTPPEQLVALLNRLFSAFDALATRHGLEKIKTIGDAYMVVGGLPAPLAGHAEAVARMALEMQAEFARLTAPLGEALALRVGLHTGPVVAGVIGRAKFSYDLWGDTVNVASRMESHGVPGAAQCSEATAALLEGRFRLVPRGSIDVKGKGGMATFLIEGLAEPAGAVRAAG